MTDQPAIRLSEVSKRFPGSDIEAVRRLSLDIPRGSIVALIGPSGCGKTTTLRMINRLIESTGGRIEVDGQDISVGSATELRRGIGCVIQQVGLFPHCTIAQNIATVPRTLGRDRGSPHRTSPRSSSRQSSRPTATSSPTTSTS